MSSVTRQLTGGLVAVLLAATASVAQENKAAPPWQPEPSFTPSNESIDRDLDQSLDQEFNDTDERGEPIPDYAAESKSSEKERDSMRGVRLRMLGAYWRAHIHDLSISFRDGNSGGQTIEFNDADDDGDDDDDDDFLEATDGGSFSISLDVGKWVTVSSALRYARWKDDNQVSDGFQNGFTFGSTTFGLNDQIESEFTYWAADVDASLNALNNDYITLSVGLGLRYTRFETELTRNQSQTPEDTTLESVVPAVSIGLAFRPVKALEFFGRARIGHLSYETDDHWAYDDDDDEWDYRESVERESTTIEVDLGISLTLAETIGVVFGYRFDHFEMERLTSRKDESVEGTAHGLYGGVILSF